MSNEKQLSTQEIIKQQLERKKQAQNNKTNSVSGKGSNHRMQSQQTKKVSNSRRKMGS